MTDSSQRLKLVIVGGVAAGASAATRARRLSETAEILVLERGPDVSFANCGMPYYLGNEIKERSKLLIVTPARMRERYNIEVRTRSEVVAIDRANKRVRVRDLNAGTEYEQAYDKLVLTPGAAPFVPPLPGVELPGIFTLRNLADMDRIKAAMDGGVRHATVIGGGFIGLELIENFTARGIATSMVEINPQVLPPLDPEMTAPLLESLAAHRVDLRLATRAAGFEQTAHGLRVLLSDGEPIDTQLVVLGAGVRPENQLATDAGLEIGPRGGIRVDQGMQTSDPDIYAAGDAVETCCALTQSRVQVPLAGPANRQGRIIADRIFGRETQFRGAQGTAIVGLFGKVAAMTGLSEKEARKRGLAVKTAVVHPANHAGYYPGAESMTLKLVYETGTGRIWGAQGVGGAGVDKRIDVLAVAIQARMSVFDLEEMELCYAPQFGSAKDPVNMVGFVAANEMRGDHPQLSVNELAELLERESLQLVDVRMPSEFDAGTIPTAINVPVDELRDRLRELDPSRRAIVFCKVGQRGYLATRILSLAGFDVANVSGGYTSWLMLQIALNRK